MRKQLAENYHHYIVKLNLAVSFIFVLHLMMNSYFTSFLLIAGLEVMLITSAIYARSNKRGFETALYGFLAGALLFIALYAIFI